MSDHLHLIMLIYGDSQLMNAFDDLKVAWENRKRDIEARMNAVSSQQGLFAGGGYGYGNQYGNQYGAAQEYSRLEQVRVAMSTLPCLLISH